ncbi:Disease resistance protein [Quillaja saponaria]|uniref:Disease resistance protein n=1 Tax=Quillaja saponaria TaxID=32244 RepID=A0AAD7VGZ4_QUISA|nr:Disease resistance protein [Quillaja saponaria]KAJ7975399.1 Disease resistance protein [Quillaja saponaria]
MRSLGKGKKISPALLKAIEESRISIVIFSENYACSSWCLDELVKILECMQAMGQLVRPVFFNVDPSDVRHQKRSIGEAMARHEERFKNEMDKVQKWKSALHNLANLSGWHVKSGYEYDQFIQEITDEVCKKLNSIFMHVVDHPVGLESRVSEVTSLLEIDSSDGVRMIGIFGIGGIGKSTIARALYNFVADKFDYKIFIANVRENSIKQGLEELQKEILSEVLMEKGSNIHNVNQGIAITKDRLLRKRLVLLILDDVDKQEQLQALAGGCDWFGSGSRVIITTRDKHLLDVHGVDKIYNVKEFNDDEALELFSWKAFKRSKPEESWIDISKQAVFYGKGLPLVLEIIGSELFGKTIDEWECTLQKYKSIPNRKIQEILRISFDNLEDNEKAIFLDIACFFKEDKLDHVKHILNACGFYPNSGIRELTDKSLIAVKENRLWMHDLIQDMGREIVRQESPLDPGKRSRLWFHEDIVRVLNDNMGTEKLEAIVLDLPRQVYEVEWNNEAFEKMKNLRMLKVAEYQIGCFSKGPKHLPNNLRVLFWDDYPSSSLPPDFHPKKLVILELRYSRFALEQPFKKYDYLTHMDLRHCSAIKEIPNISQIPNLVDLSFDGCKNLVKVHNSVGFLSKLVKLSVWGCTSLKSFPPLVKLTALEHLDFRSSSKLERFPDVLGKMEKIRFIDVGETAIKELPSSFGYLIGLEKLCLTKCIWLSDLPSSFLALQNLKELDMGNCPKIRKCLRMFKKHGQVIEGLVTSILNLVLLNVKYCDLSDDDVFIILSSFHKLEKLNLSGNNFVTIPTCIKELLYLETLQMDYCSFLHEIPEIPPLLRDISTDFCRSLTKQSSNILLSQGLKEVKNLHVQVPGRGIPDWFDHRVKGGSLSFWVCGNFPVITVCSVFGGQEELWLDFQFNLFINGRRVYVFRNTYGVKLEHFTWLHDLRTDMSSKQWRDLDTYLHHDWNQVELSFALSKGTVNWCGVHAYKQETDMKNVLFTNPDSENWSMASDHFDEESEGYFSCTSDEDVEETEVEATSPQTKEGKEDEIMELKKTLGSWKIINLAKRIHHHVKLRPGFYGNSRNMLIMGIFIIISGGRANLFKHEFGIREGEKLLKASQCYFCSAAGLIAGALFISTEKVAFCDELVRKHQFVIPIEMIKKVNQGKKMNQPAQEYIEIITEYDGEFRFIGFLQYEKAWLNLLMAIS